jgi:Putative beta-lactamase-inhibitor-like, PepSY-like
MCQIRWMSAAIVVCVLAGSVRAGEEGVPLEQLPKAVTAAVKKRFPMAQTLAAGKETEDGKVTYEVTIKDKDHRIDVSVTPDGTITELERRIEEKELPKTVAAAAKAKYPGATFHKIEEIVHIKDGKESLDYYEFQLTAADKTIWEACFTPEGKLAKDPEARGKEKQ